MDLTEEILKLNVEKIKRLKKLYDKKRDKWFKYREIYRDKIIDEISKNNSDVKIKTVFHTLNQGKGSAIKSGIKLATSDLILIQDADLEYDPDDYTRLLEPFVKYDADVVYGSRFIGGAGPKRLHMFWHQVANKILTLTTNIFTNLNMTDMDTGYKVFK